jgi:hypothetical protein
MARIELIETGRNKQADDKPLSGILSDVLPD